MKPIYRVTADAGFFAPNDHLYMAGQEIEYDGVPNAGLEPLNREAEEKYIEYLKMRDEADKKVSEASGIQVPSSNLSLEEKLDLATSIAKEDRSVMGVEKTNTGVRAVNQPIPETSRKRGRPVKVA